MSEFDIVSFFYLWKLMKNYWYPLKNTVITETLNKQRRCKYISFRGACFLFFKEY